MDTTTLRDALAGEVRALMARRRIRQVDLAAALGMTQSTLSGRLHGHYPFTIDELARLAEFFGVDAADLVRGTPCFSDCDESDELGSRLRHPTGLTSLEAEIERIGSEEREEAMSNPTVAA